MIAKTKAAPVLTDRAPQQRKPRNPSVPRIHDTVNVDSLTDEYKLQMACWFAEHGYALCPVRPKGKRPYTNLLPRIWDEQKGKRVPKWEPLAETPATVEQVEHWLTRCPAINYAVFCGGGLVVIDDDGKGLPSGLVLPVTATVRTRRGFHYWFRTDKPLASRKFSWGELRGQGNYVIGPGSTHESGHVYDWVEGRSIEEAGLTTLPQAVIDFLASVNNAERANTPPPIRSPWDVSLSSWDCSSRDLSNEEEEGEEDAENGRTPETGERNPDPGVPWATGSLIEEIMSDEGFALRLLETCGVEDPQVGQAFCCILPGHEESEPSAAVYRRNDGTFGYCDYHEKDGQKWYSLAEVYRAHKTGETIKLNRMKGEAAVWMLRAAADLGYLDVTTTFTFAHRLPKEAPEHAKAMYTGFKLLLGVRALYDQKQAPQAPFSWRFAKGWTGKTERVCRDGITWLIKNNFLVVVEKRGRLKAGILGFGQGGPANGQAPAH